MSYIFYKFKIFFLLGIIMPVTINQIRKVQWARSFDWELKFTNNSGLKGDFLNWFPAVEVDFSHWDIASQSFDLSVGTINVPKSKNQTPLRITFNDNAHGDIETWLREWGLSIVSIGKGLKYLDECTKLVFINKLDVYKKVVSSYKFYIYPEGNMSDSSNNQSSAKVFSQDFRVVGIGGGQLSKSK
jgi:hypothetical protein